MQARFDFTGTLIPPTEDLPTHLGLHHHGEEPEVRRSFQTLIQPHINAANMHAEQVRSCILIRKHRFLLSLQRAGYSLQELFMLSRSQFIQQRSLALSTLANILSKVYAHPPGHTPDIFKVTHLHHPVGACRGVHVCSERQCRVHAAGRGPGLPAALCP